MPVDPIRKKLKKIEDSKVQKVTFEAPSVGLVTTVETPAVKKPEEISQRENEDRARRANDTVVNRIGGDRRKNRAQAIEKAPAGTRTRMLKIIYDHKAKFHEERKRSFLFKAVLVTVLVASVVTGVLSSWTFVRDTTGQVAEVLDIDTWWNKVSTGKRSQGIKMLPPAPVYLEKSYRDLERKVKPSKSVAASKGKVPSKAKVRPVKPAQKAVVSKSAPSKSGVAPKKAKKTAVNARKPR